VLIVSLKMMMMILVLNDVDNVLRKRINS
jgi:hypothetical protein